MLWLPKKVAMLMAKKRANGEGSIRKRADGRWEGRYTAGYHPETGKRNDSDRAAYETAFLNRAKALGIPCVLWDNNYFDDGDEWFGLFDRTALRCNSPEVLKAMLPFRAAKK